MLRPKLITAPSEKPVSLAEAKAHLRVDFPDEDILIEGLIDAATDRFDGWNGFLRRCLVSQIWEVRLDAFPHCGRIELPFPDIDEASVAVAYVDLSGSEQVLGAACYHVVNEVTGAAVLKSAWANWPETDKRPDAVRVQFTAGFGGAEKVPASIKAAILLTVGHLYEHREDAVQGAEVRQIPNGAESLARQYRRIAV
ncbi:phage protein DNA packaging protein [Roseibium sp. TrichSKD4]|uniref:head-tail connector protein n=1 Tax=Roseibium sp. TrichSKD4 TaxID=744980 RepID=UPI0001E56B88|nr:head-tail connector protein [Roseibium sp. TrichSKD4]EFO32613.1 phage protein DNA packaging protein [Roseibium sp. TrichSKD4]